MNKARFISLLALSGLLAACTPRAVVLPEARQNPATSAAPPSDAKQVPMVQPERPQEGTMPAIYDIDKRFSVYKKKVEEWQAAAEQLAPEAGTKLEATEVTGGRTAGEQETTGRAVTAEEQETDRQEATIGQGATIAQAAGEREVEAPWRQCLRMASSLYDSYSRLREQAAPSRTGSALPEQPPLDPMEVAHADIVYLESGCDAVYQQVTEQLENKTREPIASVAKLEVVIPQYVQEKRYEEALVAYRNLERRFPDWQPSLPTRRAYGLALLHTGQVDKAALVLQKILPQLGPAEQIVAKRQLADLLWATNHFDEAKSLYQSLAHQFRAWKDDEEWVADQLSLLENLDNQSEEMAAYVQLLRIYVTFDGREVPKGLEKKVMQIADRFPGSMIAERGRQLLQHVQEQSQGWANRRLAAAESLVAKQQFTEALTILNDLEQRELPPSAAEQVRQLIDETHLAMAKEKEKEKMRQEQDLASRWDEGTHLLDLEQYDEASKVFTSLLGTEYERQARDKLKETANRAASEMRRQAAGLFVKARGTSDPDRKLDYLLESRRLLKTIIEKYQEADIISKVMRNLEVIDQNIRQLKPDAALAPIPRPASAAGLGTAAW
ncbi:MAG: hypothetical protein P8Y63_03785 [Deltaproteobacteria bacterium]